MTVFVIGGFRILGLYIHGSQYLTVHPFKRFKLWIKKQEHVKVRVKSVKIRFRCPTTVEKNYLDNT